MASRPYILCHLLILPLVGCMTEMSVHDVGDAIPVAAASAAEFEGRYTNEATVQSEEYPPGVTLWDLLAGDPMGKSKTVGNNSYVEIAISGPKTLTVELWREDSRVETEELKYSFDSGSVLFPKRLTAGAEEQASWLGIGRIELQLDQESDLLVGHRGSGIVGIVLFPIPVHGSTWYHFERQ